MPRIWPFHLSHLYDGVHNNPGLPLCFLGWTRLTERDGSSYSIFRGNRGDEGTCGTCGRRAAAGLRGITGRQAKREARRFARRFGKRLAQYWEPGEGAPAPCVLSHAVALDPPGGGVAASLSEAGA